MNITVKNGEVFGSVFIVLYKIDGIDTVNSFSELYKTQNFAKKVKGKIFEETLDREE